MFATSIYLVLTVVGKNCRSKPTSTLSPCSSENYGKNNNVVDVYDAYLFIQLVAC